MVNYDSGQVSAFGFGGTQVGWNGGLSGSVYSGYIYGLNNSNSNYSGGFTGVNGGAGAYGFASASSDGLNGGARGAGSLKPPVVVGSGVSSSLVGQVSGGVSVTNYSEPHQLGKYWTFALNPGDAVLFGARQLCK